MRAVGRPPKGLPPEGPGQGPLPPGRRAEGGGRAAPSSPCPRSAAWPGSLCVCQSSSLSYHIFISKCFIYSFFKSSILFKAFFCSLAIFQYIHVLLTFKHSDFMFCI